MSQIKLIILVVLSSTLSLLSGQDEQKPPVPIKIQWPDSISGNFGFTNNWSYPMGVARKGDGRAGCADGGHCPERCYQMLDTNGIVLEDSVDIFYSLLDTTHQFHTISCEAWCYEWAGTDFISVHRINKDSFFGFTSMGIATHCSLNLQIIKNTCFANIDLNSVVYNGDAKYNCKEGFIMVDKNLWKKGIMKAAFSFNFWHPENPDKPMFWRGLIHSKIQKSEMPH